MDRLVTNWPCLPPPHYWRRRRGKEDGDDDGDDGGGGGGVVEAGGRGRGGDDDWRRVAISIATSVARRVEGYASPTTGRCGAARSSSIQTTMAATTTTEHDDDPSPSTGQPTSGRHSSRSPRGSAIGAGSRTRSTRMRIAWHARTLSYITCVNNMPQMCKYSNLRASVTDFFKHKNL